MVREVRERDFRMPEFRDAEPKDYEFRDDGKIVRKDRWETGMRSVAGIMVGSRSRFEIEDVVEAVRDLKGKWCIAFEDEGDLPDTPMIDVQLSDGSVLMGLKQVPGDPTGRSYLWSIQKAFVVTVNSFGSEVVGWREHRVKEQEDGNVPSDPQ